MPLFLYTWLLPCFVNFSKNTSIVLVAFQIAVTFSSSIAVSFKMFKMVFSYFSIEIDLEVLGEEKNEHGRRKNVELALGLTIV